MSDVRSAKGIHVEAFQYLLVALAGLLVDFGTVIASKELLHLHYLLAICSGFILGLAVTYFLSNKYVFGTPKTSHRKAFMLFAIIGLVGLGLLNILMWLLTGQLGINYIIAKALATIIVFGWNFIARRSLYSPASPTATV